MAKRRINNSGSIFYRKDRKKWVYEIPVQYHDKSKVKSISANSQKELLMKIDKFHKELDEIALKTNNRTLVDILIEDEEKKHKMNIIKANTYGRNLYTIQLLKNGVLDKKKIRDITKKDLEEFLLTITSHSNSVIGKIMIKIKKGFKIALDEELIRKNISENLQRPKSNKDDKKIIAFTIEEMKEFYNLIPNSKYYMQYLIALNTGMRMGEINALHIDDIDFKNKTININKTITRDENWKDAINDTTKTKAGTREISINMILYNKLKEYCKDKKGYLFSEDRVISTSMVTSEMKRLCSKSDIIKITPSSHVLRHTFATRCIESGMPAVVLAKFLGHTDVSITLNTYTSVFDKFKIEHFDKATEYMKEILEL